MPVSRRHFAPGQLQFITSSTYRRTKLFDSHRLRCDFVEVLRQFRQETGFLLIGWVLMPEHFHLLIKPEPAESTSRLMQELKKRTAQGIVSVLAENQTHSWCRKMLTGLRLPPTVHSDSRYRVWQRRFYPYGVYSEKKQLEKLNYMHNNPRVAHTCRRFLSGCMRPSACPPSQHFVHAQYRSVIPKIEPPTGPRPVARVLDQASFHGIVVHVIQFFISLFRAPDAHVVEPLFTIRDSQFIIALALQPPFNDSMIQ